MGFACITRLDGITVNLGGDSCRTCGGAGTIADRHDRDGRGPAVTVSTCWACRGAGSDAARLGGDRRPTAPDLQTALRDLNGAAYAAARLAISAGDPRAQALIRMANEADAHFENRAPQGWNAVEGGAA